MDTSETLGRISTNLLEESDILVVRIDEAQHRLGSCELLTELSNMNIDAVLVDDEPSFFSVELQPEVPTGRLGLVGPPMHTEPVFFMLKVKPTREAYFRISVQAMAQTFRLWLQNHKSL